MLIEQLKAQAYLKSLQIIKAFEKIKRKDFVLEQDQEQADVNAPLSIGYGQTISQPLTVAFMLELLQPQTGDKILDVGSGSGWQTAMLAHIVGKQGKVLAIERVPELKKLGEENVSKYNFVKKGIVQFFCADGTKGLAERAPFDKIIAAASGKRLPVAWKKQLKVGGRIVVPIKDSIWLFVKRSEHEFEEKEFPGFVFVPLIEG